MIKEFVIPLSKDELFKSNQNEYFVKSVIPVRMIPQALHETRLELQENGIDFILEHFDTFFSIIVHRNKVELPIVLRGFTRIQKAIEMLVHDLESIFDSTNELQEENRTRFLNITKMLVYLFSWFVCHITEEICKEASDKLTNKKKKSTKSDIEEEWESSKEKALEYAYRLLYLPLHRLWHPPIVEDTFVVLLTKVCYKILEQSKEGKQKHIRQTIFQILGIAVKKYNHGISCVVNIIQMVKFYDAAQVATGVVQMVTECGCNGLIREIMKEIDQSEPSEADGRNLSVFLETIATTRPDIVLPILDELMDYLASEHYTMRNSTISVLGIVVQNALTGEELTPEQKKQRNECLNNLQDHILDCNAYVRSKVLQVWQRLSCAGAIPLARQRKLLAATTLRLEDKSASVRKQALQLLRALLQTNPYAAKLNKEEIFQALEKEEIEYKKMLTESVCKSTCGDGQRLELWNGLLPEIRKALKEVINGSKEDNQNRDDIESEDEAEDAENISPDEAFERVRQLMLKEKIYEAVTLLWNSCIKLNQNAQLKTSPFEAKEEFLFMLLLKTFMESEDNKDSTNETTDNSESTDKNGEKKEIEVRKRLVDYWRNCLEITTELEVVIPMAEKLLFSTTAGDAIEACTFLGTAYQFGVTGTATAVHKALFQIFLPDQSVRNNLADVYKQIYLKDNENKKSSRQTALMRVKALIGLLKSLQPGQSQALSQLVATWWNNKDLGNEELQVLWENFSMKTPDIDPLDSRSALMLITMIAKVQNNIVTDNLEVLIKIGLGPRAKTDLLLARDTCRSLLTINNKSNDIKKAVNRYPNDHKMFKEIFTLLNENFTNKEEDGYISFVTDAINAIYHLANQPDHLMQQLILCIYNREQFNNNNSRQKIVSKLSKLLYIIGHTAIKEMVHLDTSVYAELKRRNALRKLKKGEHPDKGDRRSRKSRKSTNIAPTSARQQLRIKETSVIMEDNGEEAVEGAVDDADAELINDILENHVVTEDGLLAQFVPLVLDVCQNPDKYNNEDIQAAGTLALTKMMTVSSRLCEESLQLLITILERSPHPAIRANVLMGISDLTTRFPNLIEPWMKHIYGRLRDENLHVRSTCVRVLASLIMRDMVRVRGQISELALCIIDDNVDIREEARQFFKAFSQKPNALYNVVPDILSRLTDSDLDLNESNFQEIMKYLLGLLQKEAHIDSLINKVFARFNLATTERQWRDFSYCLSLLPFSQKSIRYFTESLPLLKEKIHNKEVMKAVQIIIEQTKKKPNLKAASIDLEEKMKELLKSTEDTENLQQNDVEVMPPPSVSKLRRRVKHSRRQKHSSDEEDDGSDSDTPVKAKSASKKLNSAEPATMSQRRTSARLSQSTRKR